MTGGPRVDERQGKAADISRSARWLVESELAFNIHAGLGRSMGRQCHDPRRSDQKIIGFL